MKHAWKLPLEVNFDLTQPLAIYKPSDLALLQQLAEQLPSVILDWIEEDKVGAEMKVFFVSAIMHSDRMNLPPLQERMRSLDLI